MPFTEVNGAPIHYVALGGGKPLLLIHGTGGDADAFSAAADDLAKEYNVIAYDRRASSRSVADPHPTEGYFRRHADDAASLLKALGHESAIVVGWSAGALVALAMAMHHRRVVSSLVLYEPPFLVKKHAPLGFVWAVLQIMLLRAFGFRRAASRKFFRTVAQRRDGSNDFDSLSPETRHRLLANARATLSELDAGTGEDFDPTALKTISCPVGLLSGLQSAAMFASAAKRLAKAMPGVRREQVEGSGHFMNLLEPQTFAAAVLKLSRS